MISHVVRRGLESPEAVSFIKRLSQEGPKIEIPPWGVGIMGTTFVAFMLFACAIEYTLKVVVATLAMVETPSAAITISPSSEYAPIKDKEGLVETGPTITLVHQKPITSSIRGTIRHLVENAGRFSRWRGIKLAILYSISFSVVGSLLEAIFPPVPCRMLFVSALAGAATANLHATWTHKIISMPTQKSFRERLVSRSSWKQLALPAAVSASSKYATVYIAQGLIILLGLDRVGNDNFADYTGGEWTGLIARFIAIFVVLLSCTVFLILPALVTLIRVEASILPEDQDTIVPFDRSFAGKVVPKILGGTGAIGFVESWKSFNWEARRRVIKLYVKVFAIISLVVFVLAHVLVFELWAIMGPALGKFLAQAKSAGYLD
ncbi:hypothetical protein B0J11DRAFT_427014 [Dendryphion nanum]|uniref:Ubiquitin carrier protein n=1 Tax=Dendryphion nanum TaxID=256645 RepID=A0A9P9ECK2_9PLEO|nr:hypothetical protein B0J11DRAFT_427014 [Dendryphion nanum]